MAYVFPITKAGILGFESSFLKFHNILIIVRANNLGT